MVLKSGPSTDHHPHYRLGAKAVIVRDGRVLLVGYDDQSGLHYNFPGGGIRGDEPIRAGLEREILEETAARATVGDLILASEYYPPAHHTCYGPNPAFTLYFSARLLPGEAPRLPEQPDPYQISVRWFPVDNMPDTLLPRFYNRLIRQAARPDIFSTQA